MKYSLDIMVICPDQGILDNVISEIPLSSDGRVWDVEYGPITIFTNEDGNKTLKTSVRFHDAADRNSVEDAVSAVAGLIACCNVGSYIQLHTCHHDPVTERKGCEVTDIYEVVE